MANEVVKSGMTELKAMLNAESVQQQFKNALGEHKDLFAASLIDLYSADAQLQQCKPADLIKEALKAATLKLPLNRALGFAYVVVYNNSVKNADGTWTKVPTPTFVPGYKGYIQLAMRTGQYRTINADVVYEGELRKKDKLSGEIALDGEKKSDKIIGYFCHFTLVNTFSKTLYMSVEDMAEYALRYAPSFSGKNKPTKEALIAAAQKNEPSKQVGWSGNFNDMAIKTVIRRLLGKYGYLSVEMQSVMAQDTDEAQSSRNDAIMTGANSQKIQEVDYEEVDTETGEVKTDAEAKPAAEEGPGY